MLPHVNLSIVYSRLGQLAEALSEAKKAMQIDSDSAHAHAALAIYYRKAHKFDLAEDEYRVAIKLCNDVTQFHLEFGIFFKEQGKLDDAKSEFEACVKFSKSSKDATTASCYNELGHIYHGEANYNAARDQYTNAAEADPLEWIFYLNLGTAYRALGKGTMAIDAFKKALSIKPDELRIMSVLANELILDGRYDEAVATYEKKLDVNSGDSEATAGIEFAKQLSASKRNKNKSKRAGK